MAEARALDPAEIHTGMVYMGSHPSWHGWAVLDSATCICIACDEAGRPLVRVLLRSPDGELASLSHVATRSFSRPPSAD
jgi:hypothetical protein